MWFCSSCLPARRDTAEGCGRGGDWPPGATRLDAENPSMGSDPRELVRVQGEAGGGRGRAER